MPCILDVKIGLGRKKPGRNRVPTTTKVLKFRLCGMHVQSENGSSMFKDKYWGRKITVDCLPKSLALFFWDGKGSCELVGKEVNRKVIQEFTMILKEIYRVIKDTRGIKFTSSSLLLIYDAFKESAQGTVVKLIDFENAEEIDTEDSDALEGIENLCKVLEEIHETTS